MNLACQSEHVLKASHHGLDCLVFGFWFFLVFGFVLQSLIFQHKLTLLDVFKAHAANALLLVASSWENGAPF